MIALAFDEAEKSSDWWRHVGAVLVKGRELVATAYNRSCPSQHMSYVLGNPRDFIEAGTLSHFSDVLHSEKIVFTEALKHGVSTLGADIYVSVFPCPDCAKMIAYSGVKRCFFASGHASLDGQSVLRSQGVEMIYVPFQPRT
jgi:dCMP deaminase